jgi:hypothetical protein
MRTMLLAGGLVITTVTASFGQQVQTCSQQMAFAMEGCQRLGGGGVNPVCEQAIERDRVNCMATGTWERRDETGAKAGPDITGLRRE